MIHKNDILVVDDTHANLKLLMGILAEEGYQVRPANSGEIALASVAASPPELILLDIRMPGMDGFEVLRRLKAREESRDIPVIFLSAITEVEQRVEGLRLGAVDFISKPFQRDELLARVKLHLELFQMRIQLASQSAELRRANEQLQTNITELQGVTETLRESEDLYRTLTESSYAGIYIVLDGKFCFSNSNMADLVGYSVAEMIGMDTSVIVHPADREAVKQNARDMLKRHRQYPYEFRIISRDGGIRWVMETVTSIQYRGRRAALGNCMDVTERKRIEEDLRRTAQQLQETTDMLIQSEKMAATGKLATGVTHEILNPINILSMRLQLLEQRESLSDSAQDTLSICNRQIDRVVKIVKDLDQLTKAARSLKAPCDLNSMIRQFLAVHAERLNGESIAIDLHLAEDLPILTLDKGLLNQVFLILMNNALDAMEGRDNRRITIITGIRINHQGLRSIRMTISDRGHGIKEENLYRIFDPFFTTREPGKGTGIGLAIAYRAIEDLGGKIWAENNEWGGASFFFEIPINVGEEEDRWESKEMKHG